MTLNLRINMISHVIILLYTILNSFKHITTVNDKVVKKIFAFCAFTSAIWLVIHRDTYLPFLGYCALPPSVIKDPVTPPNSNVDINLNIDAKDGTKVIYWGSKSNKNEQPAPKLAYGDYSNDDLSTNDQVDVSYIVLTKSTNSDTFSITCSVSIRLFRFVSN